MRIALLRIDTQAVDTTRSAPERFRSAVGNDVVDLAHPRCGDRPREDPLLRRILAPGEREWLEDGGPTWSRPLRLWACWASKEAAYKVHTQAGFERGRTFRPSLLSCDLRFVEEGDGPAMALRGRVLLDGLEDGAVEVPGAAAGSTTDTARVA